MISYMTIQRSGVSDPLTRHRTSTLMAIAKGVRPNVDVMPTDKLLSECFNQYLLAEYISALAPTKDVETFKNTAKKSFKTYAEQRASSLRGYAHVYEMLTKYIDKQLHTVDQLTLLVKCLSLPKSFTIPYLNSTRNIRHQPVLYNPVMLIPTFCKDTHEPNNDGIVFIPQTFTVFDIDKSMNTEDTLTKYLSGFDWTAKNWRMLIDALASLAYQESQKSGYESFGHLPGMANHLQLQHKIPSIINSTTVCTNLVQLLQYLIINRGLVVDSAESIVRFLHPGTAVTSACESLLKLYAMEAADDRADDTETIDASDEEESSDATDEDDDEENEGQDDVSLSVDETDTDAFDFDAEDDRDDADTSADNDAANNENTPAPDYVPDDPLSSVIEVVNSETFDEYIERTTLETKLLAIINNPPAALSADDVVFLKHWVLEWMSVVSIASTKRVLRPILNRITAAGL